MFSYNCIQFTFYLFLLCLQSQNSLCKDRTIDGWTVTTCICCNFEIYAQHIHDVDRVLVNSAAEVIYTEYY